MKKALCAVLLIVVITAISCSKKNPTGSTLVTSTVTDIDGNVYTTVKIGNQWWTAENLKVTHYRDGTPISNVTNNTEWSNSNTGAYCAYNNNPTNADTYGNVYNWFAVTDVRNIAPEGWHVPTDEEWKELEMCLGMSQSETDADAYRGTDEGSKLAGNAALWADGALENNAAFGEAGFSALPSGYRSASGIFGTLGCRAFFWTATQYNSNVAWYRDLYYSELGVGRSCSDKQNGSSLRLVKDN